MALTLQVSIIMKVVLIVFILVISSLAWGQKSLEFDLQKAQLGKAECQRLVAWNLIPKNNPHFRNDCDTDAHHFYTKQSQNPLPQKIRIGSFNLLHPGMDKTLFKDFKLLAQMIHNEFDILAANELVDVLADARRNNIKIAPQVEMSFSEYNQAKSDLQKLKKVIEELEQIISIRSFENDLAELQFRLKAYQKDLVANQDKFRELEQSIINQQATVSELSTPGLILFKREFFRKKREKRLGKAKHELQELINNKNLIRTYLEHTKNKILAIETSIAGIINGNQINLESSMAKLSQLRNDLTVKEQVFQLKEKEFKQLSKNYRVPGYIELLKQLRAFNPNWSLIIAPHGDAAVETNTQELVGHYYRADQVQLTANSHCSTLHNKNSFACIPNFYEGYMGQDYANLFSRRPFMASFTNNNKTFHVLASHVIFESPKDESRQKQMLLQMFNNESLTLLGTGINKENYARFVEVAATLKLIDELKKDGLTNIIYTGDFNLESKNKFWATLFALYTHNKLLVEDLTSLSEVRFRSSKETDGLSKNYDHFILGNDELNFCKNARAINFINSSITPFINQKYIIRKEAIKGPYQMKPYGESLISQRVNDLMELWNNNGAVTTHSDLDKSMQKDVENFRERVFMSQLLDSTYYKVFIQVMSDHIPIAIDCTF